MLENKKKVFEIFFIFSLILFFFILNLFRIKHGLPFFVDEDEGGFLKSSLAFLSYFTDIKPNFLDPIVAPLLNVFLTCSIIFFNELLINNLSILEIKNKIYLNPEIFILYGRISSLFITSLSIGIFYLILKELKINTLIILLMLVNFSLSLVTTSVAIVNGKNSYYLFFYILQIYLLIKYYLNLDKFNLKTYFLFGLLSACAWGVNYWSALVALYAVLILHIKKYNLKKINYFVVFLVIFFLFGPLLNALISSGPILELIYGRDQTIQFDLTDYLSSFTDDILRSAKILFINEKNILILILLSFAFIFSKKYDYKYIFIIISFLLVEPILLFALSLDVSPQLRYFSGLICVILILTSIVVNQIYIINKSKIIVALFFILNFFFIYNQIILNKKVNHVVSNNSFYKFYEENENNNYHTLYFLGNNDFMHRKNADNLIFYKELHNKRIILNPTYEDEYSKKNYIRDDLNQINKKINKLREIKDNLIEEKKLKDNFEVFESLQFKIKDLDEFFSYIKKNYRFIVIDIGENTNAKKYIIKNFEYVSSLYDEGDDIIFMPDLRSVMHFYAEGKDLSAKNKIVFGSNYMLLKLN